MMVTSCWDRNDLGLTAVILVFVSLFSLFFFSFGILTLVLLSSFPQPYFHFLSVFLLCVVVSGLPETADASRAHRHPPSSHPQPLSRCPLALPLASSLTRSSSPVPAVLADLILPSLLSFLLKESLHPAMNTLLLSLPNYSFFLSLGKSKGVYPVISSRDIQGGLFSYFA